MNTKVLILRGIPGSGKTTIANEMCKNGWGYKSVSADKFMCDSKGNHIFDYRRLGECHARCMEEFINFCQGNNDVIVVDNSNIKAIEISPYIAVANAFQLPYVVATVRCSPQVGFDRGIHGVPIKTIEKMHRNLLYEEKYFPWNWNFRGFTNLETFPNWFK